MGKVKHILLELKGHAPFTASGAILGLLFMAMFKNSAASATHGLFAVFHPLHVVLSAMVTASMFKTHLNKNSVIKIILIGYFGSIGIATLSDIVIPHIGSSLLGLNIPTHAHLHHHGDESHEEHTHSGAESACSKNANNIHLGFLEEWYLVNPAAISGIAIAFFLPRTKFPHAMHVLISTWASSSYLLMTVSRELTYPALGGLFITLFLATWIPCCISDIIFPLLFVKFKTEPPCPYNLNAAETPQKQSG